MRTGRSMKRFCRRRPREICGRPKGFIQARPVSTGRDWRFARGTNDVVQRMQVALTSRLALLTTDGGGSSKVAPTNGELKGFHATRLRRLRLSARVFRHASCFTRRDPTAIGKPALCERPSQVPPTSGDECTARRAPASSRQPPAATPQRTPNGHLLTPAGGSLFFCTGAQPASASPGRHTNPPRSGPHARRTDQPGKAACPSG